MPGRVEKTITLLECYVEQQEKKGTKMNKPKIFLTSIVAIMLVAPSFATVGETNFETNQTGVSSCEIDILGVDENTANANATWSPNAYTCLMGTYLPAGNDWTTDSSPFANDPNGYAYYPTYPLACQPCPVNSYCPGNVGGTQWTYSATTAQGATACSGNYTLSDAGSMAQGQCYHNCTAAETGNIKTNGTVTGRVYQSGLNTCEPSDQNQCAGGYHYVAGQSPVLPDTATNADDTQYVSHMGSDGETKNTDNDLTAGEWKVTWTSGNGTKGTMKGIASCNTTNGTVASSTVSSASMTNGVTGGDCWCKTTSWTPSGGTELRVSSAWLYNDDYGIGISCAASCALRCAYKVKADSGFRSALFGAVGASPAQCAANTITLNWGGYGANNDQSQQTTCTYGGTIDTPTTAPTKRGHTFTGWRFVAPSGN